MNLLKEKNRQQIVTMFVVCLLIFMVIMVFINFLIYKNYCKDVNTTIIGIIFKVEEHYPNVEKETLIHILNQKSPDKEMDLSDFGISSNTINVIKRMENGFYYSLIFSIPIIVLFGILAIGLFLFYFLRENRKIEEITKYIDAINRKHYDLCLLDNEEGAFSQLKNELYKITVMLREQAEKSKKEKEEMKNFMADISHQIKTPMTSILVLIDNLRENEKMPVELRQKFLMEINHQIQWVNSLVNSLLKLSRFSANVVEMKREKIYLYEFFEEIKKSLLILAEARNVTVQIQEERNLSFVGDHYWEREAITNLLKNAIEHTLEGRSVKIFFEGNYFYTRIFIKDEGIGMEPEEQKRVFERFYRGRYASIDGVGIGLSLAKKIIESDYGQVKVSSQKGKGTIFEIRYEKHLN